MTNNNTPTFIWRKPDSAASYRFQLSQFSNFSSFTMDSLSPDTAIVSVSLSEFKYYWRVKAYKTDTTQSSAWSPVRTFTVDTTPPFPPVLKGPPDMALTKDSVLLRWAPVAQAARYHVQVSDSFFILISDSATVIDTSYAANGLPDGKLFWRVSAQDTAGNWSPFSEVRRLRVDGTKPFIVSTKPVDGAPDANPYDSVQIVFSEPVTPGSFQFQCTPDQGSFTPRWSANFDTVRLGHIAFTLGLAYQLRVNDARDPAGNGLQGGPVANPWNITVSNDGAGPSIAHTPFSSPLPAGQVVTINATISDLGSGVLLAYINFRDGGRSADIQEPMARQTGDNWQGVIPANRVGGRGLSYYINAYDSIGNSSRLPALPGRFWPVVQADSAVRPVPLPGGAYRMVSVPFVSPGSPWRPYEFADDLGQYDATKWRLFRWQGGSYAEFNAVQDIVPGRAYWLIAKNGGTIDVGAANTVPDSACHIPLTLGWNMVGNPFGYPVNLADVVVSGTGGPFGFNDTANTLTERRLVGFEGGYANKTQLMPWDGYWVRSLAPGVEMVVPALAAVKGAPDQAPVPGGWSLALAAEVNGLHDCDNRLGISPRGRRDNASEPPVMGPHVSLSFESDGRRLADDYRQGISDGQSWRFSVLTDQNGPVDLSWSEQGERGTWQYAVVDLWSGQVLPQCGAYRYQPDPDETAREFAVLAGSGEYISGETGRMIQSPATTLLGQNRPNPFADRTIISYQLATAGPVKLSIYNILGQQVKVLVKGSQPAGRYRSNWDGRDDDGRTLANGLYFYRLEAPGKSTTMKLAIVR